MQDYVRPEYGEDPQATLDADKAFFRAQKNMKLWVHWRNPSSKTVTLTFLLVASPKGKNTGIEPRDFPILDVSRRVARIIGCRVDTQGGARVDMMGKGQFFAIGNAIALLSDSVFGSPDAIDVELLEPE